MGATGPTGQAGTSRILNYADFHALMPPDNAAKVAPGTSQIVEVTLIETTTINSILTVRNPAAIQQHSQ